MVFGLAAIMLAGAQSAGGAGPATPNISGTVTVTGSDGKDELVVSLQEEPNGSAYLLIVEPAATVTSTGGPCPPLTDPLTGRPIFNECRFVHPPTLVVGLKSGDDTLEVR